MIEKEITDLLDKFEEEVGEWESIWHIDHYIYEFIDKMRELVKEEKEPLGIIFDLDLKDEEIDQYMTGLSRNLEPKTHCCECTPGKHFCRHMVHIQYPNCDCDPKKYILKKNPEPG